MKQNPELSPCNFNELCTSTDNIYESVYAVSQRSVQLLISAKLSFRAELDDLNIVEGADNSIVDSDIQELVSKRYERAVRPLVLAIEELKQGKLEIIYE